MSALSFDLNSKLVNSVTIEKDQFWDYKTVINLRVCGSTWDFRKTKKMFSFRVATLRLI